MEHQIYMQRCIDLAAKALGHTYPNPLVGAVIVHNGEIIGEGWHQKAGRPHAEINAINSVKDPALLSQSTLYVSLEPCSHYGKTPPCAEKIREIGFKKVVVGTRDTSKKVDGGGIKIIQNAGIQTITDVLEKECRLLNKRFFTFQEQHRPYITLKWAESGDGFLDRDFRPTAISNTLAKQFVHQLRHREHAILVGARTAQRDNPSLTVREVTGENPIRILIDFELKTPGHFHLFNNEAETIVLNKVKSGREGRCNFIKIGVEDSVPHLLNHLWQQEIQSVIIEGGRHTLQQFINQNLWDEAIVIHNPGLFLHSGTRTPDFLAEPGCSENIRDNKITFYKNPGLSF